jgi:peptidoglycan/xylan/chitin deacetylase (PgdA/CDA1 family)
MYHQISNDHPDRSAISVKNLERQFTYLAQKGYRPVHFKNLGQPNLSGKPILITFDDAYQNIATHLPQVLKKFEFKATLFVPVAHTGQLNSWDSGKEKIMSWDTLNSLDPQWFELGAHSFEHRNFKKLSTQEWETQISQTVSEWRGKEQPIVFSYPYGGYPQDKEQQNMIAHILQQNKFRYAVRIGNRHNAYPFLTPFALQRLDVSGTFSLFQFILKLQPIVSKWI